MIRFHLPVSRTVSPAKAHLHGTFFWHPGQRFILVQILNAVELATSGEFVDVPYAEIRWNPSKLRIVGARVVSPKPLNLEIGAGSKPGTLQVPRPGRYTALYLKLA